MFHYLVHGASVVMGVRLLQWNGFAFDSNPAVHPSSLYREKITSPSFLCLDKWSTR